MSADPTLVQRLSLLAAATDFDELPADLQKQLPSRILDIVGLCLAALPLETSRAVIDYVTDCGGKAEATVIGHGEVPAAQAALANGVLAHSLDYDDTHLPSILHPSASVVPASLAAAQAVGATGPDLLAGVAAGLEICIRLGMAGYDPVARQSSFFERGQHATSICGAIASAAAVGRIWGLGADQLADAMGLAVSMTGGVIEANRTGGTVKRLHCGWAAHAGVTAADLARRGFTGPPTVLEGRFGFYAAFLNGVFDPTPLTEGLGSIWQSASIHYKPYPANHFTHAIADAALALKSNGVLGSDIERVTIGVAAPTVRTIGEPIEAKRRPESGYHAKFSAPFVFAAALLGGGGLGLGLDDFSDDRVSRPDYLELMDRVDVVADDECAAVYPDHLPAVVTVSLTDGRQLTERVMTNRGGPDRPLSEAELAVKFIDNASVSIDLATAHALSDRVLSVASLTNVTGLLDLSPFIAQERS